MNRREALQALIAMPAVKALAVADVKPNDVIIVECAGPVSDMHMAHIQTMMEQIWPSRKCVVLPDGIQLRIARETA